jgi:undecaprenyl diphosphate synthase
MVQGKVVCVATTKINIRESILTKPDILNGLDPSKLPAHIAFIMDGNRRWAKANGKDKLEGHRAGARTIREVLETVLEINTAVGRKAIEICTFYAFSKENWNRSIFEVTGLMRIFEATAIRELSHLHERNIKVKTIGNLDDLPENLQESIHEILKTTHNNTGVLANFALSYSGRNEIVKAVKRIWEKIDRSELHPDDITEDNFQKYLDTGDLPDPDLLVRTSGEMRFSNFLLWQIAYTELWVTDLYWPDFHGEHLVQALMEYQKRDRRYGGA